MSRYAHLDTDELSINGELLDERDLADEKDIMDLATPEGVDGEWLLGELWKDLRRGEMAEAVLAEAEMRRVIEFNRGLEHKFIEGAGQVVMRIPMSVAMHWIARYGHDFFKQRDSIEFLAARNPGMLIKTKGKPQITIDGFKTSPGTPADAAAGVSGVRPAGAGNTAPAASSGKRGRWGLNNPQSAVRNPQLSPASPC
jgi:hypothetical protein